jgi:UDP-glucose 4-epimerase
MIVVTGAAGLFGINFIHFLLRETNESVLGIDSLFGGNKEYLPKDPRFQFVSGDLSEKDFQEYIEKEFFKKEVIQYVFHFAAYAAEGLSPFIRCFNYKNNVLSTAFIVNMCIEYNINRLVFTSSMAVYGRQVPPFDESMIPSPVDPYGVAKYMGEMDVQIANEQHGLEYCIIRPHNVYGPFQNIWDPYRNVLGIWMYKSTKGMPITIYGDGEQERAFSYIDDILPCLWKAAVSQEAKNQIINLGGCISYTLNEAAHVLSDVTGNENIVYLEGRHEVKHAYSTFEKSIKLLGFEDKTSLKDGLQQMWNWVKEQSEREQKKWEQYEITKQVYSYWKV